MHVSVLMVSSTTLDPYSIIKSLIFTHFENLKNGHPRRLTELRKMGFARGLVVENQHGVCSARTNMVTRGHRVHADFF